MKRLSFTVILSLLFAQTFATGLETIVSTNALSNSFPIVAQSKASNILYDENDFDGVKRAIRDLQSDIKKVTDLEPALNNKTSKTTIIIGTIGKSALIDDLIKNKKST